VKSQYLPPYEWNDDVTNLIPESMLHEALENPDLSEEDKEKIRARLESIYEAA